jgi:flagellin-like protein
MPRRLVRGKDRAVSPVIATIIIVAVAIVMSIAVAYWVLGLAGTFTRYEKVEIMAMYANKTKVGTTEGTEGWNITACLRNTGSAAATINMILINGKPLDVINATSSGNVKSNFNEEVTLSPGERKVLWIFIPKDNTFAPGMVVEVTFHSAAGSDYPKVVVLP